MGQLRLKKGCDPMDPASWEKKETPVFEGLYEADNAGYLVGGVGHASFTKSPDDKEYWIHYHSMKADGKGWSDRYAYIQKFTFDKEGNPVFGVPADPSVPTLFAFGALDGLVEDALGLLLRRADLLFGDLLAVCHTDEEENNTTEHKGSCDQTDRQHHIHHN